MEGGKERGRKKEKKAVSRSEPWLIWGHRTKKQVACSLACHA
jgi:hypothetical protein